MMGGDIYVTGGVFHEDMVEDLRTMTMMRGQSLEGHPEWI